MPIVPHLRASPRPNFPHPDWLRKLAGARRALVATDFDGTLSEIVADPDAAVPAPGAQAALAALAARADFAAAIVSGRSLADLRARCPVAGAWYLGGHGNEIEGPGVPADGPPLPRTAGPSRVARLAALLRSQVARWPGTWLEVKPWSLGVHYRQAPQLAATVLNYTAELAARRGFRLVAGNRIAELLPANARNKGQALLALRAWLHCDFALYFGDEATDEDVFVAADDRLVGVHIGPPAAAIADGWDERATAASFWLASPAEVVECLGRLPSLKRSRI